MKYKFLDRIRSDVMFEAYGNNLKELFENSAEALFSVICKISKVQAKESKTVDIESDNLESLMIDWLQYLIALVDTEQLFFSKIIVDDVDKTSIKATLFGEPIRSELGETVVKAVTYYKFNLEKVDTGYKVTVSLDI
ncbi:MAG: archease [Nanoarchaeota archaeon]